MPSMKAALVALLASATFDMAAAASVAGMQPFGQVCCEYDDHGKHRVECKMSIGCMMHGGEEVDEEKCGGCSDEKKTTAARSHDDAARDDDDAPHATSDKICCAFDNFGEHRFECKLPTGCKMHGGEEVDDDLCGGCSDSEDGADEEETTAARSHDAAARDDDDATHATADKICCAFDNFGEHRHECKLPTGCKMHGGEEVDEDLCGGCSDEEDGADEEETTAARTDDDAPHAAMDKICCAFDNFGEHRFECKLPTGCKMHGGEEVAEALCGGCSEEAGANNKATAEETTDNKQPAIMSAPICCEYKMAELLHHGCMPMEGCSGVRGQNVSDDLCGGC